MNIYEAPLRKIPSLIDLELEKYKDIFLDDPYDWASKVRKRINPEQFIRIHEENSQALRARWVEWKKSKSNNETNSGIIISCEEKLESYETHFNLLKDILISIPLKETIPTPPDNTAFLATSSFQETLIEKDVEQKIPTTPSEHLLFAFEQGTPEELEQLFYDFLDHPQDFLELKRNYFLQGTVLFECPCGNYDRRANKKRFEIESIIVEALEKDIPNKENTIHLASIGAGGLLQDFIILGKLIQKGFKNIEIRFVDHEPFREASEKLKELLNKLPHVSIKSTYSPFLPTNRGEYDFIYAIDFDVLNKDNGQPWREILHNRNFLKEEGEFYLFGDEEELILRKDGSIVDLKDPRESCLDSLKQSPYLDKLRGLSEINIVIFREEYSGLNFKNISLSKVIQFLFEKFKVYMNVNLYDNKGVISAYRLDGESNVYVLKNLSNIEKLNIKFNKTPFDDKERSKLSTITHIFIRQTKTRDLIIEFGDF